MTNTISFLVNLKMNKNMILNCVKDSKQYSYEHSIGINLKTVLVFYALQICPLFYINKTAFNIILQLNLGIKLDFYLICTCNSFYIKLVQVQW